MFTAMKKACTAGLLSFTLLLWVNAAVLPGSKLPAHSMARPGQSSVHVHGFGSKLHSCCPRFSGSVVVAVEPTVPCGPEHSCCFSQAKEVSPGLPVSARNSRSLASVSDASRLIEPPLPFNPSDAESANDSSIRPYSALSTILRI